MRPTTAQIEEIENKLRTGKIVMLEPLNMPKTKKEIQKNLKYYKQLLKSAKMRGSAAEVGPNVCGLSLSPECIATCQAEEVFSLCDDEATRTSAIASLNEYYASDRAAIHGIANVVARLSEKASSTPATYGIRTGVMHLRGAEFGVDDIASACRLVESLLSLRATSAGVRTQSKLRSIMRELSPPLFVKGWQSLRQSGIWSN
jgi:hypothetical protein